MYPDPVSLKLATVSLFSSLESVSRLPGRLLACLFGFLILFYLSVCVPICEGHRLLVGVSTDIPSTIWVLEVELQSFYVTSPELVLKCGLKFSRVRLQRVTMLPAAVSSRSDPEV